MKELVASCWQNTGMQNQLVWLYKTKEVNGNLGDRVGTYCGVSADMTRLYTIGDGYVSFQGFIYHPNPSKEELEGGITKDFLARQFAKDCEDVHNYGKVQVDFKDIAENMMAMAKELGLGWNIAISTDFYTREECWNIYQEEVELECLEEE